MDKYETLVRAVRNNPSQENIDKLGKWCWANLGRLDKGLSDYDWGDGCWTCDEFKVFPIKEKIEEGIEKIVGYELR